MPSRKFYWSEKKIKRYLKEGRGQGSKEEYKPWVYVHSTYSMGAMHKFKGNKIGRMFHLLSSLEYAYFMALEWNDDVIDIRERYPLLNRVETMKIAEELGISYPHCKETSTPLILTTDFLVTAMVDGKVSNCARTVIPHDRLINPRTLERIQLERKYWLNREVDFKIITEKALNPQFLQNYLWFRVAYNIQPLQSESLHELLQIAINIKEQLQKADADQAIHQLLRDNDQKFGIEGGTSVMLFRHLLSRKEIVMDMSKPLYEACKVEDILEFR